MRAKLALLSGFLLAACAQTEHKSSLFTMPLTSEPASKIVSEPVPVQSGGCDGLGYYLALSRMTPDEKKQELPILRSPYYRQGDSCGLLELAMLLSQPASGFQNDSEADKLLLEFLDNSRNNSDQDRALAHLLREVIQERLRSRKARNSLKRKLKQEQGASAALKKRLQELTSQLEQLKSLERDINQQEQDISAPPKGKAADEK